MNARQRRRRRRLRESWRRLFDFDVREMLSDGLLQHSGSAKTPATVWLDGWPEGEA